MESSVSEKPVQFSCNQFQMTRLPGFARKVGMGLGPRSIQEFRFQSMAAAAMRAVDERRRWQLYIKKASGV